MMHYHLITGSAHGQPSSNVVYDSYDDSIMAFVRMGKALYSDIEGAAELNIDSALQRTKNRDGLFVGTEALLVAWCRCEYDCRSGIWN